MTRDKFMAKIRDLTFRAAKTLPTMDVIAVLEMTKLALANGVCEAAKTITETERPESKK